MSSSKPATTTRPDLPNQTSKKGLRKVPAPLPECPAQPSDSTSAVVVPKPVDDPPEKV